MGISMTCMVNSTAITLRALEEKESLLGNKSIPETDETLEKLIPTTRQQCSRIDHGKKKVVNDYGGTYEWDASIQVSFFDNILS